MKKESVVKLTSSGIKTLQRLCVYIETVISIDKQQHPIDTQLALSYKRNRKKTSRILDEDPGTFQRYISQKQLKEFLDLSKKCILLIKTFEKENLVTKDFFIAVFSQKGYRIRAY